MPVSFIEYCPEDFLGSPHLKVSYILSPGDYQAAVKVLLL
jgi:hypothetical protein